MATTSGRRNFVTSFVMLDGFISENFVKILVVVVELLSKRSANLVSYTDVLKTSPCLAPSGVHFCHTLPVFGSFQSLLNYSRKSIPPRKLCSEHKLYLSFRRTHYQNFRTITLPLAEISAIERKQRMIYGFHSNNFRNTNFCSQLSNA